MATPPPPRVQIAGVLPADEAPKLKLSIKTAVALHASQELVMYRNRMWRVSGYMRDRSRLQLILAEFPEPVGRRTVTATISSLEGVKGLSWEGE